MHNAIAEMLAHAGVWNRFLAASGTVSKVRVDLAQARALCLVFVAIAMTGCYGIPTSGEPSRLVTVEDELPPLVSADGIPTIAGSVINNYNAALQTGNLNAAQLYRNEFISNQMSTVDLAYTVYETKLTNQVDESGFWAKATTLGLTTAAPLIAVQHTANLVTSAATVVNGTDSAFNEKILITKTVQNVQTQMRKDRHDQAAIILTNMKCSVSDYPLGMALSDIELYRRAGTFSSGLIGVTNTVNNVEANSKANKNLLTPGGGAHTGTPTSTPAGSGVTTSCVQQNPGLRESLQRLHRAQRQLQTLPR
jgi:hypothetical protein